MLLINIGTKTNINRLITITNNTTTYWKQLEYRTFIYYYYIIKITS